jgi:uncharacterized membrane protein
MCPEPDVILNSTKPQHQALADNPTPLDLLERRFAAGEIDREDFEERK